MYKVQIWTWVSPCGKTRNGTMVNIIFLNKISIAVETFFDS